MAYRYTQLRNQLRQSFKDSKKNKSWLSRKAKIQRTTVYAFLSDQSNETTVETLEKIAKALKVRITVDAHVGERETAA
jgi:DNA-binding phage protein